MLLTRRIYVSLPADRWLSSPMNDLKWAIVDEIEKPGFLGLKGKRNALIAREQDSKMPADLGGDIYALLHDRAEIGPIERVVSGFISAL